jgi:hypothetical protein
MEDFRISSLLKINPDESLAREFMASARHLLRFQFKLDVENYLEETLSELLKHESYNVRELQWMKRSGKKNISLREISKDSNRENIEKEIVLDFEIKNQWEMERNKNLSHYDRITLVVKCLQCNLIYPISFGHEKELLNKTRCKNCQTTSIGLYDFENESNNEYSNRLLIRFPWMKRSEQTI